MPVTQQGRGVIERYRDFLPVSESTPIVSLGEGNTPLIYSPRLSERVGRNCAVFIKYEGLNPTGSFKDRGMTLAVSKALERGTRTLICASTGNTSASAAAYAARAGISCAVILPAGTSKSRRRLPRRFASVTRRAGNKRALRSKNRKAQSTLSQTQRSLRRRCGSHDTKEFSSSRRARRQSPDCSSAARLRTRSFHSKTSGKAAGSSARLPVTA